MNAISKEDLIALIKDECEKVYELKKQKVNKDEEMIALKTTITALDEEIDQRELTILNYLKAMQSDSLEFLDSFPQDGGLVVTKFQKAGFDYGNEKQLILDLKEHGYDQYIKIKTTESLDKTKLKKDLKINSELASALEGKVGDKITEYVVVTNQPNTQKMLEHINESTNK